MYTRVITGFACLWLLSGSVALAEPSPIILETFTGYPDDALISVHPAGPAVGLEGDWYLNTESNFYVNRTEEDLDGGTGKAVYDFPLDYNGMREAYRLTYSDYTLFENDGDVFYASFLIEPALETGRMVFTLNLDRLDGGGQSEVEFGMKNGRFFAANVTAGPAPETEEMLVVLKVEYQAKGKETVTLWVDPAEESSSPVIDKSVDLLSRGGGKITAVAIRGEQMAGQPAFFDNLRVGSTFEDVTYDLELPVLSRDIGLNGLFHDGGNPGHGFGFNVHESGLTVLYLGHTSGGEQLWLASDLYEKDLNYGEEISLDMYQVNGSGFGTPAPSAVYWGTITLNLEDCDSGHASFDGADGEMEMDFTRLTRLPGIDCQY